MLVDAAFELLGTKGGSATTVRAVCTEARLNPRYFYESFETLDDLLVAVYDRTFGRLTIRVASAVRAAEDDSRSALHAAVEATVVYVAEDPRRGRVLYSEALGNEALSRRRIEAMFEVVDLVRADAERRRGDDGLEHEVDAMSAAMIVGGFSELLVAWLEGKIDADAERVIDISSELLAAIGAAAVALDPA